MQKVTPLHAGEVVTCAPVVGTEVEKVSGQLRIHFGSIRVHIFRSYQEPSLEPRDPEAPKSLPYANDKWEFQPYEKCCTCDAACCMGWCCACFSVGQMVTKMKDAGMQFCMSYSLIVCLGIFFVILDFIYNTTFNLDFSLTRNIHAYGLYMFLVLFQLRSQVRRRLNLPGNCCEDCCCSLWCTPCVVTQLMHQLWARPAEVPGCSFTEDAGHLV
mmetsp:Transcript_42092/g.71553  ORF Transcript_42092/g.71553 Transcript_42092/m.71553 type:complete len:214 (+) Transcript_42092:267-908(+)